MKHLALCSVLLAVAPSWAQDINQTSEGWCSPNVGDIRGPVTIVCQGVSPEALKRLNELLDLKDKELGTTKLSLADKIKEAEDWAKRYRELEDRLATQEDRLAQQAREALEQGNLDRAGAVLDEILRTEEKTVDRAAANNFSRAQLYQLQFRPVEALPYLEKAYRYRPENADYAFAYALILGGQNDFKPAEDIYTKILTRQRDLKKSDPAAYLPDVAGTLNNLADFYKERKDSKNANKLYRELDEVQHQLESLKLSGKP